MIDGILHIINKIKYKIDYYELMLMTLKAKMEVKKQKAISYNELIEKL